MGSLRFRFVVPQDIELLRTWHGRSHVLEWWPEPPTDQDFLEYCASDMNRASRFYIALLDDVAVGFIQCYSPVQGHADGWWLDEHDPGVRGIDQFLANPEQLNAGLGTQLIRDFVSRLFEDPAITRIQVDPEPRNVRAIRCYEKVGFRTAREVVTPDGRAALMYLDKPRQAQAKRPPHSPHTDPKINP